MTGLARWLVCVLLLSGCAGSEAQESGFTVVTAVYPLAWVVSEVAPDADVLSLAAQGQDPHDQELSPQQRGEIEQADLLVYLGDIGFQPQVEAAAASRPGATVSVQEVLGEGALLPLEQEDHEEEEGEEHADEAEVDPHFWFDTSLLAQVATAVGDAAAQADPEKAEQYRAAAERVRTQIEDAGDDVAALLDECQHDTVVVGHEAFAYLLEPHGLEQRGISQAGGHAEASPQDIADLSAEIRARGLPAVLSEPVEGRSDAEAVAREAGVEVIDISSMDIVDEAQSAKGYPALLLEQAQAVAEAAACGPQAP